MFTKRSNEMVTVDYKEFITETDKAWLLNIEREEFWIPKSICELDEDNLTIEIPEWLADEKMLDWH